MLPKVIIPFFEQIGFRMTRCCFNTTHSKDNSAGKNEALIQLPLQLCAFKGSIIVWVSNALHSLVFESLVPSGYGVWGRCQPFIGWGPDGGSRLLGKGLLTGGCVKATSGFSLPPCLPHAPTVTLSLPWGLCFRRVSQNRSSSNCFFERFGHSN